jgi:surfactin synthase thioesterase subunit
VPSDEPAIHDLPLTEFIAKLRGFNGTPEEILNNQELMQLLTPLLRADFKMAETYRADRTPLECPIVAFAGTDDKDVTPEKLAGWRDLTTQQYELHWISGGHFFIERNRAAVLEKVNAVIARVLELHCAS